jgi:hypothetical protein
MEVPTWLSTGQPFNNTPAELPQITTVCVDMRSSESNSTLSSGSLSL